MRNEHIENWTSLTSFDFKMPSPVFIVGSPRSGTTLMRSLLDSHPDIFCPPCETFLFNTLNATFRGHIWKDHYEQLPFSRKALLQWFRNFIDELFANLSIRANKRRWAEKTPSHVLFMDFIDEIFPDAQFVHMIRNGYHVVKSLKNIDWAPNDVRINAREWIRHVEAGRKHGRKLTPKRYIEIRFEDLVDNPEEPLKKLCDFLDEKYDPRMLEFHLPANNSWGIELRPLQKKNDIGNHKELNFLEKWRFRKLAGPLMTELGYYP